MNRLKTANAFDKYQTMPETNFDQTERTLQIRVPHILKSCLLETAGYIGARSHLLIPQNPLIIWVWAHAGERAKMRSSNLFVAMGYELNDKEILGAHSPNSQNR